MKRNIAVAAVTAAVLVGGGLATTAAFADSDGSGKDGRTAASGRADGADASGEGAGTAGTAGTTARITVGEAVGAALKAVPGTVTGAELDDDDDSARGVWELDVRGSDKVWHDVDVDARSGKVLSDHEDDGDDRDRHAPRSAAVSLDAAVKAALGAQPGSVTAVDLDDDGGDDSDKGGALRWDVDVTGKDGKDHELHVDAKSGKVTVDQDDDNDGDDDNDDSDDD
ncbi:MAG TPA: PepSY domain-containing protein [Streptomyces sp.]|uniref:PepSY domain-containing protein n=1 Tax=Streptomyces sp. TaxID=1931 RepID=UPI002BF7B65A|nr:PepSY domain-containing protein [Streptomyces sp.]HWU07376.1 PepSY domain-containing protein [Streptomyces sp.]